MRLESRKILTTKKVGFAVCVILVMFTTALTFQEQLGTTGYVLFNRIQGITSDKIPRPTTLVTRKHETTPITKQNHKKDKVTTKITKATTETVLTKNMPNKATMKIVTHTPSTYSGESNVTMSFQTKTTLAGRNETILMTKRNHEKDTTTKRNHEKDTTTKRNHEKDTTTKRNHQKDTTTKPKTTKTTNKTAIKVFRIKPSEIPLVGHRIPKSSTVQPKSPAPPKHVICLNLMGRLGNLMFEYASSYGIARSKGMEVVISENERIAKIFHLNHGGRVVKDTSMCKGVKTIHEVRASAFDNETVHFGNDKNVALWGYLQSYKYFEKVSNEVRRQFTFRDSIKIKAEKVVRDILQRHLQKHNNSQDWIFVGVHVRRGDMVNHPHGYMVAPKEYFDRTRNMFRALKNNVLFLVCSDDIKWCQANLASEDTYFVEGNTPEVDMAILSSCNHTISSVGSFSWWSAWLAKGLVTYYCPPARPGSGLRKAYSKDFNDYFPSKWIRIQL